MKSFLSHQSVLFIINNTTLNSFNLVEIGILQGSLLSPILSVIYTSFTITAFSISNTIVFSYIDDITILCHYSSPKQAEKIIYDSFYFFKNQLYLQGLTLDFSKIKILYFFKKYSPSRTPPIPFQLY